MRNLTRVLLPLFPCAVLLTCGTASIAQDYRALSRRADSLHTSKEYQAAATLYQLSVSVADFRIQKMQGLYNAAACENMNGAQDSALDLLRKSIALGFNEKEKLERDNDFLALHGNRGWAPLLQSIPKSIKSLNKEPHQSKIHTGDIHRFWEAYDKAQADTAHRREIYARDYFKGCSIGMEDYMGLKVRSIDAFVRHYDERPMFYRAIRVNTLKTDSMIPGIYGSFEKLKAIYPQASFPDIYFVMGAYTSAGTVSDAGLLIGINQVCRTPEIPTGELNLWQKNNFKDLKDLPGIVSHELIHFQQDDLLHRDDTTTLFYVLVEGMADFMGELISGNLLNKRIHVWAKGKEKRIWQAFTKDMYLSRYSNWIANGTQETPDNPADQGYWIGYQICKAYYDKAKDKQQALYDMLHFKNAKAFLEASGWEEEVSRMQ